eukprot:SAG11_NODE_1009_length_6204_cov_54.921149_3_plen_74_part_00
MPLQQFKELCLRLNPNYDDEAIEEALEMIDVTGDGEISFEGECCVIIGQSMRPAVDSDYGSGHSTAALVTQDA